MAASLMDSLKKSIGKKKGKTLAYAWLADMERSAGDLDTALQRVDGGLTEYPADVAGLLVRSMILFEKEDFQGCVETCEKVLMADPFCLSAQKRMGDAYDKLGNEAERNKCYRRVHDMDPLDDFWKEDYEAGIETVAAAAAAVSEADLAMPEMSEGELSMGNLAEENLSMDDSQPAESSGGFFEKAPDEAVEEDKGPKFGNGFDLAFEEPSPEAKKSAVEDVAQSQGSTAFSSGFDMEPSEPEQTEEPAQEMVNEFAIPEEGEPAAEDDPFASLAALLPNVDSNDDAVMDSLQASLDSAMAAMANEEPSAPEVFPTDEEAAAEVSGSDVNSAISDMFGLEDDLEPEEPVAPASPFAQLDLPSSLEDDSSTATTAQMVFGADSSEDKPQSVDNAFDSIFGEDELPEETSKPAVEDKPQSVDSAFDSIFGEDELPEELPQSTEVASSEASVEEPVSGETSSLFEKSASEDLNISEAEPEAAVLEEPKSADNEPQSVDSAFDSIFGEDELPEELPQSTEIASSETSVEEPVSGETSSLFEKSASEDLNISEAEPEAAVFEEPKPADNEPQSVDSAFDSIFGEDELPEEKPQEESAPEFSVEGNSSLFEKSADDSLSLTENDSDISDAKEQNVSEEPSASGFSVDSAFDSMFGDDELPEEKSAENLSEQVNAAETELKMPAENSSKEEPSMESEVGGAFASMFGEDDDLDLPSEKAEETPSQEDTAAAIEEKSVPEVSLSSDLDKSFDSLFGGEDDDLVEEKPATEESPAQEQNLDLDNLDSAVDGAFKGLFNMEDDLPEEPKPNNSGVDFLMSGDSDDEVSSGLIKDPTAPLDRTPADLDESLNTRTLAEIYFEQGLFGKALDIYEDLARKEPENQDIMNRLMEVEKAYREKFGDNANG